MKTKRVLLFSGLAVLVLVGSMLALAGWWSRPSRKLGQGPLADGRILQIEGVSYGTHHRIGGRSVVEPIQPWLPQRVVRFFAPRVPHSQIDLETPGLVVWVNAFDPVTGKPVDCQKIRVECIDEAGELFGAETSSWFGEVGFWRVGHIFHAFPRTQPVLTLLVSCWKHPGPPLRLQIPNPCVTTPARWEAHPLPQRLAAGALEVELTSLVLRTNGGSKQFWQTPCRYWEPVWKLRRQGEDVGEGWGQPEWTAEDPTGNRGKFLGTRQPVLRFSAEFYPAATNLSDTLVLGQLAAVNVATLQSNAWKDITLTNGSAPLTVLGLYGPGMYIFTGGRLETNPAVRMGPTVGGAPSGWVGQSQRISPVRTQQWHGHYTSVPVVYIRAPVGRAKERLGLRLRDEQGRYWLAQPEPQGAADGVWPFLVKLPPNVTAVTGEVVLLTPIEAEFTVQTGAPESRETGVEPLKR